MTYCLVGNGLTIMADEEYLTISSSLEPPHSFPSGLATHNPTANLTGSQYSNSSSGFSSQNPNLCPHVSATTIPALAHSADTPTTCTLAHPSQPLTTQPPKAKHHPIQQGLGHYIAFSESSRPVVPQPQPPAPPQTPITAQIIPSVPHCVSPPVPTLPPTVLSAPAQSHMQPREEPEKKERDYKNGDDEDEDEEESRRKASDIS